MGGGNPLKKIEKQVKRTPSARSLEKSVSKAYDQTEKAVSKAYDQTERAISKAVDDVGYLTGLKSKPSPPPVDNKTMSDNLAMDVGSTGEEQGAEAPEDKTKENVKKKKKGTTVAQIKKVPIAPATTGIQI